MKAVEVVDSTDQLHTADTAVETEDTAVKTKDTAVKTKDTAMAVDDVDVDVDDNAAAAAAYLQTDAHTVSVFSMNRP